MMHLARTLRTVRYLTARQWVYRALCRGRFVAMRIWPRFTYSRFSAMAQKVPAPNAGSPLLAAVTAHVVQLQQAVHGQFVAGVPHGKFTFLNREIDFGGIERVDWRRELGEKNNPLWRMNLAYMGYLVPLFEDDARTALPLAHDLLTSMRAQNPWSTRGVFRDVWHPYTVSHRIINLLACLHLAQRAGIDAGPAWDAIVSEIRLGAAFVRANLEHDLRYNHLLKNLVALATVACAADKDGFASHALRSVQRVVLQQFLLDGVQAERAPMYHALSLLDLRILRDACVLPAPARAVIAGACEKAERAMNAMIHPDGDVALFNDSWIGEAPRPTDIVSDLELCPKRPTRFELPKAGYIRLAHGQDSVVMDFGACGPDDNPGHAHADFLSLELSVAGERAIVDPGVPTYSEGELRDRSRSAHSHNGPAFVGLEPIEYWSSFRVGRRGYAFKLPLTLLEEELATAAWHSGYMHADGFVARAIRLEPGCGLLIADLWAGASAYRANSSFLIADEWRLSNETPYCFRNVTTGMVLRFTTVEGDSAISGTERYYMRFGVARTGTRVTIVPKQQDGIRIAGMCIFWDREKRDHSAWLSLRQALISSFRSLREVRSII